MTTMVGTKSIILDVTNFNLSLVCEGKVKAPSAPAINVDIGSGASRRINTLSVRGALTSKTNLPMLANCVRWLYIHCSVFVFRFFVTVEVRTTLKSISLSPPLSLSLSLPFLSLSLSLPLSFFIPPSLSLSLSLSELSTLSELSIPSASFLFPITALYLWLF